MKKKEFLPGRDYVHPQLTEFAVNAETVICESPDVSISDLNEEETIIGF